MMRFLADHMLGTLAKWLRLLGFDTLYPTVLDDDELIRISSEKARIILTRDKNLASRSNALYIESDQLDEQVKQVFRSFNLKVDDALSRCSLCNESIMEVEKWSVSSDVPEAIFFYHDEFWKCTKCNKIYWKGSHWKEIMGKVGALHLIEGENR
jgi:uncharacterized protein with PIN domain